MDKKHEPTRKQVLEEICNELKKPIKELSSKACYWLKEIGKPSLAIIVGGIFGSRILYSAPTILRVQRERKEGKHKKAHEEDLFYTDSALIEVTCEMGILLSTLVSFLAQSSYYTNEISQGRYKMCLIPLATNLISGCYELGRKKYIDARKRLVEKHEKMMIS